MTHVRAVPVALKQPVNRPFTDRAFYPSYLGWQIW